jgi:putative endonuclease
MLMRSWLGSNYRQGHFAEGVAACLLRCKGYKILKRRYKTPVGEIDILARRGYTLVAVEVKQRSSFLNAGESITLKQRKRIEMALSLYLRNLNWVPKNIRFDAIYLIPYKWPKHIISAWIGEI